MKADIKEANMMTRVRTVRDKTLKEESTMMSLRDKMETKKSTMKRKTSMETGQPVSLMLDKPLPAPSLLNKTTPNVPNRPR